MLEGTDQMVHGLPHWGASVILRRPVSREFGVRSEEHTSELQSQSNIVCRLLLEKKNVLRTESHILTTEGVAMLFEKMSKRRAWLELMGVKVDAAKAFAETSSKMMRYLLLLFSR